MAMWKAQVDSDVARILCRALREHRDVTGEVHVGPVRHIGSGLSRHLMAAPVTIPKAPEHDGMYTAAIPRAKADLNALRDRSRREAGLHPCLIEAKLPFRTPAFAWFLEDTLGPVLVQDYLAGTALDTRRPETEAWRLTAGVAAVIHRLSPKRTLAMGPSRCAGFAEGLLRESLVGLDAKPEVVAALSWLRAHPPADEPTVTIHGDLLGQNLLVHERLPVAVIDWEHYRIGDPAFELAVATRGRKQPFGRPDGLERLLAHYHQLAPRSVDAQRVRWYELVIALRRYRDGLVGLRSTGPEAGNLRMLRRLLAMVHA